MHSNWLSIFLLVSALVAADRFALIVAPRTPYVDYGVPSESCRLYNDLIKGGMKEENIILMSSKVIANHPSNPFPGQLFTDDSPDAPGVDYAQNCLDHIDYDESNFRGAFLLNLMTGDVDGVRKLTGIENPKVLNSGPDDEVMIYFTSHGMKNEIVVGDSYIVKNDFYWAIHCMHDDQKFKHLLIFLETCYSGSMFEGLTLDDGIFVITAADNNHESYESHCPPDDVVDGKAIGACLSCLWDNAMEWFIEGDSSHTLDELFEHTHAKVAEQSQQNTSHFGDIEEMGKMTLRTFLGDLPARRFRSIRDDNTPKIAKSEVPTHLAMWKAIRADKKDLAAALKNYQEAKFAAAKKEIEVMRLGRMLMNEKAADMALKAPAEMYSVDCVRELSNAFVEKCGHTYPFSESTINMLKNICLPGMSVPNVDFKDICM